MHVLGRNLLQAACTATVDAPAATVDARVAVARGARGAVFYKKGLSQGCTRQSPNKTVQTGAHTTGIPI